MAESTSDNAGSTSTSTASSAPASSTPASGAAPSAAASLERASASLESASSTGSTGLPAGAGGTPPGASTGTATSTPAAAAPSTTGEAPEHRIEAAVRNARKEILDQLSWAQKYKPEDVEQATQMLAALNADPRGFLARLAAELETEDPPDPEPDLQSEDGKKKAYSTDAMKKIIANVERRLTRQLEARFGPALEYTEQAKTKEEVAAKVAEGRAIASEALTQARTMPHFKENEVEISKTLAAMNPAYRRRIGSVAALHVAYNHVLTTKVIPSLKLNGEQEAIDGFRKSANASAGQVQPGAGSTGKPVLKEGDVDGLARHLAKLSGEASV